MKLWTATRSFAQQLATVAIRAFPAGSAEEARDLAELQVEWPETPDIAGAIAGGSFAWLQIGFLYGSEHYPYLFISSCYNLPSLLSHWNLSLKAPLSSFHFGPLHFAVTLQWILRLLYLGALALCALGAARHARARDPRLLIAVVTPWLLMFALLAQMHERYLLWGAVLSAVALGVSARLTAVHFLFSLMSATMITQVLLMDKKLGPTLSTIDFLERARPLASAVLLVCVAIYFREVLSNSAPLFRPRRIPPIEKEESLALAVAAALGRPVIAIGGIIGGALGNSIDRFRLRPSRSFGGRYASVSSTSACTSDAVINAAAWTAVSDAAM